MRWLIVTSFVLKKKLNKTKNAYWKCTWSTCSKKLFPNTFSEIKRLCLDRKRCRGFSNNVLTGRFRHRTLHHLAKRVASNYSFYQKRIKIKIWFFQYCLPKGHWTKHRSVMNNSEHNCNLFLILGQPEYEF